MTYCQAEVDGVNVCWPPTPVGETASVSCPERFHVYQFSGTGELSSYSHVNQHKKCYHYLQCYPQGEQPVTG